MIIAFIIRYILRYPMFETTTREKEILRSADYHYERYPDLSIYLCTRVSVVTTDKNEDRVLRLKIYIALRERAKTTLHNLWPKIRFNDHQKMLLRRVWIRKLLEYNP